MDIIVALIALAIGLVALFFGYRLFTLILPILGFVAGAAAGAQAVFLIFGDGFLATLTSIIVAVVVGLVFAALAYFVWALGVVLAVAGMGFALGAAILPAIGLDADVLSWVIGVALAAVFAIVAVVMRLPKAIVIGLTALWGSGASIAGVLVFLNEIEPEQLGYGAVDAVVSTSFLWILVFVVLAAVGAAFQVFSTQDFVLAWADERTPSDPAAPAAY